MKNLRTSVLCVCVTLYSLCAAAQKNVGVPINEPDYNKPKLFKNLPDNIPVSIDKINSLFSIQPGEPVDATLSEASSLSSFQFKGQVISSGTKYNNTMQSIVISSSEYNGARFTITKVIDETGVTAFRGRIVSLQSGDLFELQNINGKYSLIKRNLYDMVSE